VWRIGSALCGSAFEAAGIEFIENGGVRLKNRLA
jgi:hypothetical protein